MKKISVRDIDILELIPQRPPVVMVDRLVSVTGRSATSVFTLTRENIFVDGELFQESGLIENIAQTAAALHGYQTLIEGGEVKNGYIGSIKNLEIRYLPVVGEQLITRVTEEHQVMGASVLTGESRVGERIAASCELKVFIQ
jgi:3-hydroxymyristoyl/3-hydroxydecanoyl-(acyl carrier protein) dehydratase